MITSLLQEFLDDCITSEGVITDDNFLVKFNYKFLAPPLLDPEVLNHFESSKGVFISYIPVISGIVLIFSRKRRIKLSFAVEKIKMCVFPKLKGTMVHYFGIKLTTSSTDRSFSRFGIF